MTLIVATIQIAAPPDVSADQLSDEGDRLMEALIEATGLVMADPSVSTNADDHTVTLEILTPLYRCRERKLLTAVAQPLLRTGWTELEFDMHRSGWSR